MTRHFRLKTYLIRYTFKMRICIVLWNYTMFLEYKQKLQVFPCFPEKSWSFRSKIAIYVQIYNFGLKYQSFHRLNCNLFYFNDLFYQKQPCKSLLHLFYNYSFYFETASSYNSEVWNPCYEPFWDVRLMYPILIDFNDLFWQKHRVEQSSNRKYYKLMHLRLTTTFKSYHYNVTLTLIN